MFARIQSVSVRFVLLLPLMAVAASGQITIDGQLGDDTYGSPKAVQNVPTGFGDNTNPDRLAAGGSELNAAYAVITNGSLYILLTGNLENNFNWLELFIDCQAGGQNTLSNNNPDVDFDRLNNIAGLTFDAGFEADIYMGVSSGNSPVEFFLNFAPLKENAHGIFMGSTGSGNTSFPANLSWGIQAGIDNGNTNGVTGVAPAHLQPSPTVSNSVFP